MRLLAPLLCLLAFPALAETYTGHATAQDGDSLRIGRQEIRLFGIDAPELTQTCAEGESPCGRQAKQALETLIDGQQLTCTKLDESYGRAVCRCFAGETDIARALVRQGHALAYRRFTRDYVPDQRLARQEGLGIWAGEFTPPPQWRREHPYRKHKK